MSLEPPRGAAKPAVRPSKTEEQLDAKLFAEGRKTPTRLAAAIGAGLVVFTLYFGIVNAWILMHAEPGPFRLIVENPRGPTPRAIYRTSLTWQPIAGQDKPVRPIVTLNGFSAADRRAMVKVGEPAEVQIIVPPSATLGEHSGQLVLERAEGPDSLPQTLLVPVRVEAIGGLWRSWAVLRNWLIFAAVAWGLWYCICVAAFPRPSGELFVRRLAAGLDAKHHVHLGLSLSGILLPWTRGTVDLDRVWKKACVGPLPLRGRMEFMVPGVPQMWLLVQSKRISVSRLGPAQLPEPDVQYPVAGPAELMGERHWMVRVENPPQTIIIQYRQNRSRPGALRSGTR